MDIQPEETQEEERDLQQEQDENPAQCPVCGHYGASVLGVLGKRVHLRCNECGSVFSHLITE